MKPVHLGAAVALAALAFPALASAHPSVYTDIDARVVDSPAGQPVTLASQTRHVISNHGFTFVVRESNGATTKGVVDYSKVPGAYRGQPGFEPGAPGTRTRLLSEADTAAQAHATCRNVPALDAEAAILAWQGTDPFYNYVPFQKTSAGLEDDPATWIAVVKARTGVDLATVANVATACAGLGGAYTEADATVTTAAALASGLLEEETKPLEDEIVTLGSVKASTESALASANSALAAAKADATGARAEIAKLVLAATPLKLTLVAPSITGRQLAAAGTAVKVTGPPLRALTVRLTVSELKAKQLGLRSRAIARQTATTAADGSAQVQLKATGAAATAVKALKSTLAVKADAISGDRYITAKGKLTR